MQHAHATGRVHAAAGTAGSNTTAESQDDGGGGSSSTYSRGAQASSSSSSSNWGTPTGTMPGEYTTISNSPSFGADGSGSGSPAAPSSSSRSATSLGARTSSTSLGGSRTRRSSGTPPSPARTSFHSIAKPSTHVQAIHEFDPSIMPSGSTLAHNMYLSFQAGEVIRVHGRDSSGWWDGEIGSRRGWFPSNYVREFEWDEVARSADSRDALASPRNAGFDIRSGETRSRHTSGFSHASQASQHSFTSIASRTAPGRTNSYEGSLNSLPPDFQALLQSAVYSMTPLQTAVATRRKDELQQAVALVLSTVREALGRLDCMAKDSPILRNQSIVDERKHVLSDLSRLVGHIKPPKPRPPLSDDELFEPIPKYANMLIKTVGRFIQLAAEVGATVLPEGAYTPADPESQEASPTVGTGSNGQGRVRSRTQSSSRLKSASVNDLRGSAKRHSTYPPPPMPSNGTGARNSPTTALTPLSASSGRSSPSRSRRQGSYSRPSAARSASLENLSLDDSPEHMDAAFELSHSTSSVPLTREEDRAAFIQAYHTGHNLHEFIAAAEDALLSMVASFIGHIHSHHIDSHPSSHSYLIELTSETVNRVRELLTIVEVVGRHATEMFGVSPRDVKSLNATRGELYESAGALVLGAEVIANAPFTGVSEEEHELEKGRILRRATTALRAAAECARLVRLFVPDTTVDFEYSSFSSNSGSRNGTALKRPGVQTIGLGIRGGPQSLQTLTRRATSLGQLHRQYQQDALRSSVSREVRRSEEDDEEIVADSSTDEEVNMRSAMLPPRRSSRPFSQPPAVIDQDANKRRSSEATMLRSRATSMSSPGKRRNQPDPPSRSVDLSYSEFDQPETSSIASRSTLASFSSHSRTSASPFQSSSKLSELTPVSLDTPSLNGDASETASLEGIKAAAKNFRPPSGPAPARPAPPMDSPALSLDDNHDGDVRFMLLTHDYDPREITFNSEGTLVGGTLRVLVEKMTPHEVPPDRTLFESFWYTFRLFSTPSEVLDALIARYELAPPPVVAGLGKEQLDLWGERKLLPVRFRVCMCLRSWLDHHWRPQTDAVVLDRIEEFIKTIIKTMPNMESRLLEPLRKRQVSVDASESNASLPVGTKSTSLDRIRHSTIFSPNSGNSFPTPLMSKALHAQLSRTPPPLNISILDFDTLELARQLTIMESKLFAAVAPEDLLMTGRKPVPELKALSTLSNQITGWVADGILNEQDAKHRAALLKFYIKLADKCLTLNNFSTLFAVLAGLNSSTIMRLKKTWDVLGVKYRVVMERLRGVIEHTKNHAAYRARLREVTGPCLPFLGLILSDITFTQDGNPNLRPSTLSPELQLINQDKFTKLGRIAADFKRYQMPFELKELEPVQAFITRVLAERGSGSLDALYRKSLMLEPRQGSERLSSAVERPGWLGMGGMRVGAP